jgi:hypothetical protein
MNKNISDLKKVAIGDNISENEIITKVEDNRITYIKPNGDLMFIISYMQKDDLNKTVDITEYSKPKVIDKTGLSNYLGVSVSAIDNMRKNGIIRWFRLGIGAKSPVRFNLEHVLADLQNHSYSIIKS